MILPHFATFLSQFNLRSSSFLGLFAYELEQRRLFLWVLVMFGIGICLYFAVPKEPTWGGVCIWSSASLVAVYLTRAYRYWCIAFIALSFISLGFMSGFLRTQQVMAPAFTYTRIVKMQGWLEEVDPRHYGARVIVRVSQMEGVEFEKTPFRVRVTTRGPVIGKAGDYVHFTARLSPPMPPALPGGYDFARDAFFMRIGAIGRALGKIEVDTQGPSAPLTLRVFALLDQWRNDLGKRILEAVPGPSGAVAVAMVTGKRDYLEEETKEIIRGAGIFHIITISGIQMTLVAGMLFWIARRGLSLVPGLALMYPIKIWAALFAMGGAVFYDLLTGARIGTQRALWMTLILFGAIVVGRRAMSLRNLALGAFCILVFQPEALLSSSFQLSFAAVGALMMVYERERDKQVVAQRKPEIETTEEAQEAQAKRLVQRIDHQTRWRGLHLWAHHGIGRAIWSTLVASLATSFFMGYHFHEFSPYVIIGNPLTMLLIEFFAVPCALLGGLLAPLGMDMWVWAILGWSIDKILIVAGWLTMLPGASMHPHAFATWSLPFWALGLANLFLWRQKVLRLLVLPCFMIAVLGAMIGLRMEGYIAPDGNMIALRDATGQLKAMAKRENAFMLGQWLAADGDSRKASKLAQICEGQSCLFESAGIKAGLVFEAGGFNEICAQADLIVSRYKAPKECKAQMILDKYKLRATGAAGVRIEEGKVVLVPTRAEGEDRPWSRGVKFFSR